MSQNKTDETYMPTDNLEIPKCGFNKDFDGKLITIVNRGTFWSKPTPVEQENLNKDLLDEEGNLQRWYAKIDKTYTVKTNDGELTVVGLRLTKTQNDKITRLGNDETPVEKLFEEGKKAQLVCCKVKKKSGSGSYWDLLTPTQYKERFNKVAEE